jgi:uncharacterized protein with gpF-like domain
MHRSLVHWLCARWRDDPPATIAADASPAAALRRTMSVLARRWESRFDDVAPSLAEYFTKKAAERATSKLADILGSSGMTVKFRTTPAVRDALSATIGGNVGLIKSIATEHLADVEGIVMRSVAEGRDLATMAKEIEAKYKVTRKRAALVALDQNNKATAVITKVRQAEAGIVRARWVHSAAGKQPRPEHVAFSQGRLGGPYYDVEKGAFLEGKWVWPGTEIRCRCVSRPVIEGFN